VLRCSFASADAIEESKTEHRLARFGTEAEASSLMPLATHQNP
jgi:hypothetical protein